MVYLLGDFTEINSFATNNNEEYEVEDVVKSLLTGEHLYTCLAKEALETYRIMDIVLEKYYNGRNDAFWNRNNTWNKQ